MRWWVVERRGSNSPILSQFSRDIHFDPSEPRFKPNALLQTRMFVALQKDYCSEKF